MRGLAVPTLPSLLPFLQSVTVETPQGTTYEGKRFHRQRVRCCPGQPLPLHELLGRAHCRSGASGALRSTAPATRVFVPPQITGVSILRAGETMEQALTAVCKDIRLGKILIQTNHDTGEPEVSGTRSRSRRHRRAPSPAGWVTSSPSAPPAPQLHYLRLPKEISEDYVILMDSTVSTGAAAMMAVRVLLVRSRWRGGVGWGHGAPPVPAGLSPHLVLQDHDVQEDRIFLLSLLMAEMGVHSVAYAFPRVRIITTAVDKRINEEFHIIPGIGEGRPPPTAAHPRSPTGCPLTVPKGPVLQSPHCPLIPQVTLGTDTSAPMAPLPGARVTAWTAELAGHGATSRAGYGASPPVSAHWRGSQLPACATHLQQGPAGPHLMGPSLPASPLSPREPSLLRRRRMAGRRVGWREGGMAAPGGRWGVSLPRSPARQCRWCPCSQRRGGGAGHPLP